MKYLFATVLCAAAAAAVLTVPAQAQSQRQNNNGMQTGTRFQRSAETADPDQGRRMQKQVANCVFSRNREDVRTLLANSNFYNVDFAAAGMDSETLFEDLEVNYCIGRLMRGADNQTYHTYMQIQFATLRNLLAEEAYLQDFDGPPTIDSASVQDVAGRFGPGRVHSQVTTMAALADCMTYNAMDAAHEMLDSRPGSNDEAEAVAVLGPVLATCANTDEASLSIGTSLIRQIAADGLWSRSHYGSGSAS
ncbi:hypothetical protein GRI62_05560 [Erythrobacter arachoides]|uniref:Uncharacterized protein n=1 Tax=Aurantiacibacter arachoides TaxID=1850444 RepID=A0A845A0S1_9SPHN|nr:hypothetical protein [Aurantiacibacter arachoides]MXO93072.1 hypothetical protein [Aurantiacibacter arachoides]GGD52249.1 hypothetical protein GCM10011411_10130 [Aurantiacibacter arachoides]